MKNLKYILLIGFIMFFSINGVKAESCYYGDQNFYIKCTPSGIGIIDGNAKCDLGGKNKGSLYIDTTKWPSNETVNKCDKIYYSLSEDNTGQKIKVSGIYSEERYNEIKNSFWQVSMENYHLLTKMKDEDNETVNADLSKFNGKECYWKSNSVFNNSAMAYVCKVSGGQLNCTLSCAKGSECDKYYSIVNSSNNFTNKDFINGNIFLCPSKNLYPNASTNGAISSKISIKGLTTASNGNLVFYKTNVDPTKNDVNVEPDPEKPTNPSDLKDYEKDPTYIAAKAEADKYCNSPLQEYANKCAAAKQTMENIKNKYENPNNPETPSEPREDLDLDNFCKENVLRVFTTIGWVFFILKILIPLILIVFGVIDISKAVLSSKDEEIKKSAKTLVMRIIAGIIIFFIPSVLNFVVNLIGDRATGVYDENHGTFKDCTSCMLSPGQDYCGVKVGE